MKKKSAPSVLLKALSPQMMARVILTFDKATLLIVSICWIATITVMVLALYTVSTSSKAKSDAEAALAVEPSLPILNHGAVGGKELKEMVDRMQKRYPEISIQWQDNGLTLAAANGGLYRQWLTAIGQVDTLYPQFRWKIRSFCVGKICAGSNLMTVDLVGERIAFEMPQMQEKK